MTSQEMQNHCHAITRRDLIMDVVQNNRRHGIRTMYLNSMQHPEYRSSIVFPERLESINVNRIIPNRLFTLFEPEPIERFNFTYSSSHSYITYTQPIIYSNRLFDTRYILNNLREENNFQNNDMSRFMTNILMEQGQKDDIHTLNGNFTPDMLVSLKIFKHIVTSDRCNSSIQLCLGDEQGVYSYSKCSCANKIKICITCAEALAEKMIKCKGCSENIDMLHPIVLGFKCPTCRDFIPLKRSDDYHDDEY